MNGDDGYDPIPISFSAEQAVNTFVQNNPVWAAFRRGLSAVRPSEITMYYEIYYNDSTHENHYVGSVHSVVGKLVSQLADLPHDLALE